jgi:hypothetical protein
MILVDVLRELRTVSGIYKLDSSSLLQRLVLRAQLPENVLSEEGF